MKSCHYSEHEAGAVVEDRVFPTRASLVGAGHLRQRYTMQEVIEALANEPAAMQCVRQVLKGRSLPLARAKRLAPIETPPSLGAAAANYKAHQAEMRVASGGPDRAELTKDDLMAEFF